LRIRRQKKLNERLNYRPGQNADKENMVYVIYRGDISGDRLMVQRLKPPYYKAPGDRYVLLDQDLENTEPVIDRIRWRRDGILSMFPYTNHILRPKYNSSPDTPNIIIVDNPAKNVSRLII